MNLECLNDIITSGLAIHIDISDPMSWDLNTGFTSISLTQWSGAKSDNIELLDYGLTQYDNGAAQKLYENFSITPQDLKFTVNPVGYNNATGGTFFDLYPISAVTTGSTVGNYFDLFGGYLQGFYKLQDYNFEQLPARFDNGITLEVLIRIDEESQGIFYYMGSRAEDKYNPFFSGETEQIITETTETVRSGVVGQSREVTTTETTFSGVTTSEGNNLHAFLSQEVRKEAFCEPEDSFETELQEQPRDSINDNVFAIGIQQDKRLFIKRVNENGLITTDISPNPITVTGWTMIALTFKPDEIIGDPELLECLPARNGDLRMFVNGRQFWKQTEYKEFFFKGIKNSREKQIGVPYNISFGGGSFGLKHSWHYDLQTYTLYDGNGDTYINNNFEFKEYPLKNDPCGDILDFFNPRFDVGGITISADTETFATPDQCDPTITSGVTTMRIDYTGTTAQTVGNQYYIEYTGLTDVISDRDYDISLDFYDAGLLQHGATGSVKLIVYGTEDIEILEEIDYDGKTPNKWVNLKLKFKVKDNTDLQGVYFGILIESNRSLSSDFVFFIDNWKYKGADVLTQDSRKQNLTVQQNFDSSYIGGIQKLRIYDTAFDNQQILHNAKIEAGSAPYGFMVTGGGRIIIR